MLGSKIKLKTGAGIGSGVSAGSLKTASAISATLQTVTDTAGNNSALAISSAFIRATGSGVSSGGGVVLGSLASGYGAIWSSAIASPSILNYGINFSNGETNVNTNGSLSLKINNATFADLISSGFSIGSGTLTKNGTLTLKSLGANILSKRNSSNVEVGSIDSVGNDISVSYQSANLTAGTLTTARPMRFGDRATITEAGFIALGLNRQIAIEHNGVIYYIPVSTTLIP